MKRIIIIIATLLVLGIGTYILWPSKSPTLVDPIVTPTAPTTPASGTPTVTLVDPTPTDDQAATSALTALTNEPVVDYWVNQLDAQVYYVNPEGGIRRADPVSGPENISASRFDDPINRVITSPHGDAIIIVSGEPRTPVFKIFDVERRVWRLLPAGTTAAAWNPVGPTTEILFLKQGVLATYNLAKGTIKTAASLTATGLDLAWVSADTVYLLQRPARDIPTSVRLFNIKKKTLQTLIAPTKGLWTLWTPGNGGFGFDAARGNYLLSNAGTVEVPLPTEAPPGKCFAERPQLYCGLSFTEMNARNLPDTYLQRGVMTTDNLVMFLLGDREGFREPKVLFDAKKAGIPIDVWHMSKRGESLYFINRYDDKVYRAAL